VSSDPVDASLGLQPAAVANRLAVASAIEAALSDAA
jgi:hypothetical protein